MAGTSEAVLTSEAILTSEAATLAAVTWAGVSVAPLVTEQVTLELATSARAIMAVTPEGLASLAAHTWDRTEWWCLHIGVADFGAGTAEHGHGSLALGGSRQSTQAGFGLHPNGSGMEPNGSGKKAIGRQSSEGSRLADSPFLAVFGTGTWLKGAREVFLCGSYFVVLRRQAQIGHVYGYWMIAARAW